MSILLSMREFEKLCDKLSPKSFKIVYDRQSWRDFEENVRFELSFSVMLVAYNPNAICFKEGNNYVQLERVKRIEVSSESAQKNLVATIVCGGYGDMNNDTEYAVSIN